MIPIRFTHSQVARIIGDKRCSGDLFSQQEHLQQVKDHLTNLTYTGRHKDGFERVLPVVDSALQVQSSAGVSTVLHVSALAEALGRMAESMVVARGGLYQLFVFLPMVAQTLVGCVVNWFVARKQAKQVKAALDAKGAVTVPLLIPLHAMMLQVISQPNGLLTLRLLNTGGGLENHCKRSEDVAGKRVLDQGSGQKRPTAFEVRNVSPSALTEAHLRKICGVPHFRSIAALPTFMAAAMMGLTDVYFRRCVDALYWQWAAPLGDVYIPPRTQKAQTSGNCTYKSVLALVRHNLDEPAYREFKATWLHAASRGYRPSYRALHRDWAYALALKAKHAQAKSEAF